MSKRRKGFKKDGKCYVWCDDHYEEVTEPVYHAFMQGEWREEKRQQRVWRCRDEKGRRCNKKCEECDVFRFGEGPNGSTVSLDQLQEDNGFDPKGSTDFTESLIISLVLEALMEELEALVPDAGRIVDMLKHEELEKDVAKELGIAKTTLNYRKGKVIKFLREHKKDFI